MPTLQRLPPRRTSPVLRNSACPRFAPPPRSSVLRSPPVPSQSSAMSLAAPFRPPRSALRPSFGPAGNMHRVAPPPAPGWRDCALMHSQAAGHGKISLRCVHEGASDKKNASSWQYIAAMYSDSANFGKICVPCIQKAPQSAVGEYAARTSCRQGAFSPSEALKSCTARKSCYPLMDLALAQGRLPQHPANTCHLPPANSCHRRTPPPALRQCSLPRRSQRSPLCF